MGCCRDCPSDLYCEKLGQATDLKQRTAQNEWSDSATLLSKSMYSAGTKAEPVDYISVVNPAMGAFE